MSDNSSTTQDVSYTRHWHEWSKEEIPLPTNLLGHLTLQSCPLFLVSPNRLLSNLCHRSLLLRLPLLLSNCVRTREENVKHTPVSIPTVDLSSCTPPDTGRRMTHQQLSFELPSQEHSSASAFAPAKASVPTVSSSNSDVTKQKKGTCKQT